MGKKMKWKIVIDILMVPVLLFLMAYALVGDKTHEVLGMAMFVLFTCHQILNRTWYSRLMKGRYSLLRAFMTIVNLLIFILMALQMFSGIFLSRFLFAALDLKINISFVRLVHLSVPYWLFVLTSIHLGLHWRLVLAPLRKRLSWSRARFWAAKGIAACLAVYGILAFMKRGFIDYMFFKSQYAFFDFREPLLFFFFDYVAVMGLFVMAGYYFTVFSVNRKPSVLQR